MNDNVLNNDLQATESHLNDNNGNLPGNDTNEPKTVLEREIIEAQANFIRSADAQQYLLNRGINYETAVVCKVGVVNNDGKDCLCFPTGNGYSIRGITDSTKKNKGQIGIFNVEVLEDNTQDYIYVCEAPIDALSVYELNKNAIAIQGCLNYKPLIEYLQDHKTNKTLVLCFDNDKPGQTAQDKLINELKALGVKYTCFNWDSAPGFKDMNEYLIKQKDAFNEALEDAQKDHDDVQTFLQRDFLKEIQENHDRKKINTGFDILDTRTGGLQRGLYIMASISSLGKTTFIHQIADNVARQGVNVLYFSLEQSKTELVSKSLNRYYYQTTHNPKQINSLQIRNYTAEIDYNKLIKDYTDNLKGNLKIIEGNFDFNFSDLVRKATDYVNDNKDTVIILDYLQILDYDTKARLSDKEKTDKVITGLKKLSRDLNVPVIAISSLNRSNYLETFSYEALKESGSIEYTSDVVLGLQLSVLDDDRFTKEKTLSGKRQIVDGAKSENPRRVKLVCLKNRFGKATFTDNFKYYCDRDLFYEDLEQQTRI